MPNDCEGPEEIRQEAHSDSATLGTGRENPSPNVRTGETPAELNGTGSASPPTFKPGFRVYAIVIGLGITNLLAALENTVVSIAAPVLLTDLRLGANFIWVTNAFFLSRYFFSLLLITA
ncbi:hypothetical protein F4824DRAFT_405916 [Ustulina deusta]|nr:hypothetical protein F4824DRAFT_405916 [Ustulina deusta]